MNQESFCLVVPKLDYIKCGKHFNILLTSSITTLGYTNNFIKWFRSVLSLLPNTGAGYVGDTSANGF
jgi:hypothetical protein